MVPGGMREASEVLVTLWVLVLWWVHSKNSICYVLIFVYFSICISVTALKH